MTDISKTMRLQADNIATMADAYLQMTLREAAAEIERRTARVAKLEGALKPFADAWSKMPADAHPNEWCSFYNYRVAMLGDLRRAAAAMEGK